jgi:hypothetical protein
MHGRVFPALAACAAALLTAVPASAGPLPVIGAETTRGTHRTTALGAQKPSPKAVDGRTGDWRGTGTGFGGTLVRSHGELIYTDHLFDARGADDGRDAERMARHEPLQAAAADAYRLEALESADAAGQFGAPAPDEIRYSTEFGDLDLVDRADLLEVRLAPRGDDLYLLARTTAMTAATDTALLVLLDTATGDAERTVPFASGLKTTKAETALLLSGDRGLVADLASGAITALPAGSVATRPDGWDNAIEARLPGAIVGSKPGVAIAAGKPAGDGLADLGLGPRVANVAFRTAEPVREFFDKQQALALHAGTIDPFFTAVDLPALAAGANERWEPGPGYHEAHFTSSETISKEGGQEGVTQPYGVYLPEGYNAGKATPLQLWLHWRGGHAHSAAALTPGMFRDLGDANGALVVSPRGRGTSSWYVGRGMVDVEEVWADVHERFAIDESRRWVSGHSMGGWGSFLMTITHPDWFAAALPASPPVTQGAWTGLDFPGCDDMEFEEYTPCYIQANGGDARAQHTRRLLENLRHVPVAIQHGTADELVPSSGVSRQAERFVELGYRHRLYLFHTQEHFGPPIWDQWAEGAAYLKSFQRPERPARITHVRDTAFEQAIERVNNGGVALDFDLGRNHWLRALEPAGERATFDGRTLAVPEADPLLVPEAGGPAGVGQTGPYTMTGLRWEANPLATLPEKANAFEATLTGTRATTLDGAGMALDTRAPATGTVTTDTPLSLTLLGEWKRATVGGKPVDVVRKGGAVTVALPAGTSELTLS